MAWKRRKIGDQVVAVDRLWRPRAGFGRGGSSLCPAGALQFGASELGFGDAVKALRGGGLRAASGGFRSMARHRQSRIREARHADAAINRRVRSGRRFEQPVFAAVIRPHRSLDPSGFRTVMTLCCLATVQSPASPSSPSASGRSPAFSVSTSSRSTSPSGSISATDDSFEQLVLTPLELLVRRVSHRGETTRMAVQSALDPARAARTTTSSGCSGSKWPPAAKAWSLPATCRPPEREMLAEKFGRALSDVKRGY